MPRHASYLPNGVIPAILLPFNDDLSIDERAFRSHIRDVGGTEGISALTINAHSTEVASCIVRRAAPRAGHHAGRDRRQAPAGARHLGGRQPRSRAHRQDGGGGRRVGAAGVSARAVHDGAERRRWRSRISSASRMRATCR